MLRIAVFKKVAVTLKLPRKFIDRRIGTVKGPADPAKHFKGAGSFGYFVLGQFNQSFIDRHSPIDLIRPAQSLLLLI